MSSEQIFVLVITLMMFVLPMLLGSIEWHEVSYILRKRLALLFKHMYLHLNTEK